jgi:hypothetical protein
MVATAAKWLQQKAIWALWARIKSADYSLYIRLLRYPDARIPAVFAYMDI